MRSILNIAAAAAIAAGGSAGAAAADKINVGICVSWPGYAMLEVARQNDLIPDHDLKITIFEDPLGGHAALAAGQIDVYGCTAEYTPLVVDRGTDVVNVAFLNPSYGVDHVILSPEIETADLPGLKVAAPQAYIGHLLMGIWLDSEGISPDQVEWVNLNADEAVGPMMSGDLAAAYMYEPWISKVLEAKPGARSIVNTSDPDVLKTGIFMDSLYMNKNFIAENRDAALAVLKARWDGLGYWSTHVAETNKAMAKFLQWPEEDIGFVIGTNGKSFEGGIYMLDFDESARLCGVLEGDGPFGMANGSMVDSIALTNEWWIKLGLMDKKIDAAAGIDCSLMGDLAASGYRQELIAQ
ncbi:ABC transporter, substrate-binding protein, aliphatic sulfonates family [Thalassovita gelatinovora]|uniref:ABC transporter, substrate-binding protein, aliphatic sulfonates family n=1 Tax=Thalassovita gelatinovora TaxID=53501 RepID=A0A0P1FBC2_THAGE|nr:ABC transporter substrate-binding protein [Thalassovita gelatinovora]QIZ80080.1 ABC transporter substrate-binding protein [Thalassovita gelatinovora]CUH65501.1 ABC transporter, substrate-binding protein, aliphatic sulfonates family [Thalassovita gelatinovora]SER08658.1 NitT/TauT family transport system substrate-binding protein [Thalassovita gelatinovora]